MTSSADIAGATVALWRYPVKSMMGEELNASELTERGLLGDRAYALIDQVEGRIASAKNPRKWPHLFDFRAIYVEPPRRDRPAPIRITFPDGRTSTTGQAGLDDLCSTALGRAVALLTKAPERPQLEEYWLDMDGLAHRETVTVENTLANGFFDCAPVHLLTTATLERLRQLYPQGRFEPRRFRPNIIVDVGGGAAGFAESAWIGRTLAIGDEVRLQVNDPCGRCVMTTLPQYDLPKDPGILRTAVQHNKGAVGVYASVLRGGTVRRGDPVRLI